MGNSDGGGAGDRTSSPEHPARRGWAVAWGLAVELAEEGLPMTPFGLGPMEVDSAEQALEDGAAAEDATEE